MYSGIYRIADTCFAINSIYPDVQTLCADYAAQEPPEFTIAATPADIAAEQQRSDRENALEGRRPVRYASGYLETLAVYRQLASRLLQQDILLFHGSVIAVDGVGYLFTAKSGTGKSTHTALWRQKFGSRAVMVNDDKPLLRITASGVTVYGTPWDGKHRLSSNTAVPLQALCILERSETNHIRRVTAQEVLPMLLQQAHRPADREGMTAALRLIGMLGQTVPLYRLGCNMDPEAAEVAYGGMCPEQPDAENSVDYSGKTV